MSEKIFSPLYEDQDILVIEKKKAFLSQKSDTGAHEALPELIERVKGCRIYPVHRLDREVLGLMVFAKTAQAADVLGKQFRERQVRKLYWAWVYGQVSEGKQSLVHYLKKNSRNNLTTVFPRPTPGAKKAELVMTRISVEPGRSLVEVELKTGRSHQIRAQLAKVGHPIIGDLRYGKLPEKKRLEREIQLRSKLLGLKHPRSGEWKEWELQYDSDSFFD